MAPVLGTFAGKEILPGRSPAAAEAVAGGKWGMPGSVVPAPIAAVQGRAGAIKESRVPRRADPIGGEVGCWVGEGKESESKDKKGLFVTYNLCRFNQSQGEGEIGLAAPRAKQSRNTARDPCPDFYF